MNLAAELGKEKVMDDRTSPVSGNGLNHLRPVEFGYFLTPDARDPAGVLAKARLADELGYDLIGVQDHPYVPGHLDALALLGMVLAQTHSVRVFSDVGSLVLRNPAMLAKAAASLDLLSGGRFEMGIGTGRFQGAASTMGGPTWTPGQALAALEEAVTVMRGMWSGEPRPLFFEGQHYSLRGVQPGPPPAHPIPIWVGANAPRALALTGRVADGWVSPYMRAKPPAEAAAGNLLIDRAALAAGRHPRQIRRIYNVFGAFTTASGVATDEDRQIAGPPEQWAATLTHFLRDLDFDTFILVGNDNEDELRTFITDVAPAVRRNVADLQGVSGP
jgi:alkanesulfonate monooxygenase SsuD/methylene tetrahydromethanopterin reductase-like flavin-dependent oxidoreductase (luciferase family)